MAPESSREDYWRLEVGKVGPHKALILGKASRQDLRVSTHRDFSMKFNLIGRMPPESFKGDYSRLEVGQVGPRKALIPGMVARQDLRASNHRDCLMNFMLSPECRRKALGRTTGGLRLEKLAPIKL